MKILIATDAWSPQVNGVVNTLRHTQRELEAAGHEVRMLTPEGFRTFPCPTYPEIRLSLFPGREIRRRVAEFSPDCIHIATEGTIGLALRRYCLQKRLPFTTAYHTQLPEYIRARFPLPLRLGIAFVRWFHRPSTAVMVPTRGMQETLQQRGFRNVVLWSRGVDTEIFQPNSPHAYEFPRPIWINVGRVAVEKNIEAFLELDLPGSKVVVGDGPDRARLEKQFPDCHFLGYKFGDELASLLAGADAFVFPSKTDTFGLVMLEAMACGLPVAAYRVTGPIDVISQGVTGAMQTSLRDACAEAITLHRAACRRHAMSRSWARATDRFAAQLARIDRDDVIAATRVLPTGCR